MADLKKLTKLDNSLKIMKPQFKIIIDNLDKIFAVSETSMVNISKYFNEFNIEEDKTCFYLSEKNNNRRYSISACRCNPMVYDSQGDAL